MSIPSPATMPKPPKGQTCKRCGVELKAWEKKEGFCDECLRGAQQR